MRHMHRHLPVLALYLGVFFVCLGLVALPGCGSSQRQKTLHASVLAINAARDGFHVYDRQHESDLIKNATTREQITVSIEAYRMHADAVYAALEIAYEAIDAASTTNDDPSYQKAMKATAAALDAVKTITGGL